MKREKLQEAIMLFFEKYDKKEAFNNLLSVPFPELIKMVILLLFEHKFDYRSCPNHEYNAYKIILSYYKKLKRVGYVEFKD